MIANPQLLNITSKYRAATLGLATRDTRILCCRDRTPGLAMGLLRMAAAAGAGLAASATYSFSPRSTPAEAHALGEGEGAPAERHRVVVVGGGAAGLTVAAQLTRKLGQAADVAVVEPSGFHYYQPWWTMAGTARDYDTINTPISHIYIHQKCHSCLP